MRSGDGRSIAVLGAMDVRGMTRPDAIAELDGVGRLAVRLNISRLVVVGDTVRAIHTGALQEGSFGEETRILPDVDAEIAWLADELAPGDAVLVKGAPEAGLARLVEALAAGEVATG